VNFSNILQAHFVTKMTAIFHGSSGFGKSSTVYAYAREFGLRVVEKRTCYVDPIEVILPVKTDAEKLVDFWPARWLHELTMKDCPPTVLFLDEFNRPASAQTFSMFTELLLDRSINGIKISENVLILGACNLDSEDTGVVEIPDAVMKRVTNLAFVPEDMDIIQNMRSKLATQALKLNPKIMAKPGIPTFRLNGNPRQVDAVCALWETGLINEEELGVVARGRVGQEIGALLAGTLIAIKREDKFKLPRNCIPENYEQIAECEESGMALEVITMLKDNTEKRENHRFIADYLLRYATPEVCRAMKESNFDYSYPKTEFAVDSKGNPFLEARAGRPDTGQPITKPGEPWALVALRIGKMQMKAKLN
jgi:hypothetical protein